MTEAIAKQTGSLHYVVLVHLTALPSWLQLTRSQRQAVVAEDVRPAIDAYPAVAVRWIDTEGFSADCSDVLMADTDDLRAWNHLFESLRDTPIFAVPYFHLDRLVVGAEDAYIDYENATIGDASGTNLAEVRKLARKSAGAVDGVERLAEVAEGVGCGAWADLDLNGSVAAGGAHDFPDGPAGLRFDPAAGR